MTPATPGPDGAQRTEVATEAPGPFDDPMSLDEEGAERERSRLGECGPAEAVSVPASGAATSSWSSTAGRCMQDLQRHGPRDVVVGAPALGDGDAVLSGGRGALRTSTFLPQVPCQGLLS